MSRLPLPDPLRVGRLTVPALDATTWGLKLRDRIVWIWQDDSGDFRGFLYRVEGGEERCVFRAVGGLEAVRVALGRRVLRGV